MTKLNIPQQKDKSTASVPVSKPANKAKAPPAPALQDAPCILKSLPKIGENFMRELVEFNKEFESLLPKPMTYNKQDNTFHVGARQITVGCDLSTMFNTPATAEQLASEQSEESGE